MSIRIVIKGALCAAFRQSVEEAVAALPSYAREALAEHQFAVVAGETLPEMHALLAPYARSSGFFAPALRSIFVARSFIDETGRLHDYNDDAKAKVFHETGHFLDRFVLGCKRNAQGYNSDEAGYADDYEQDVAELQDSNFAQCAALAECYGVPEYREHLQRVIVYGANGRHEASAELWANQHGVCGLMPYPVVSLFPRFYARQRQDVAVTQALGLAPMLVAAKR